MRKNIHPTYNAKATIVCNTCKTEYILGSTVDGIRVELCANCHPYYTGKQMLVDTDNLVEKFNKKRITAQASTNSVSKKQKRLEKKKQAASSSQALTLKDMLSNIR